MIHHFLVSKHVKVSTTSLFNVHQGYFETLIKYLVLFNKETIKVSHPNQEMFVGAFHNGLKVGHFNES